MEDSFSVEKWPTGYSFVSRHRNRYYVCLLRFLNVIRWAHLLYGITRIAIIRAYKEKAVAADTNVVWWCCLTFLGVELLNRIYIIEERLIMLKGYGLQIESKNCSGAKSVTGIPIGDIEFLLINEALMLDEVIFYMAITLKDSDKIVVPFNNAIPRLKHLKTIYQKFVEVFPEHPSNLKSGENMNMKHD